MMKKIFVYLFLITIFITQAYSQIQWTKDPNNPVLKRGANGTWDDVIVGSPSVIYDGTMYQMWYNGNDGSNTSNIGYATSTDKINWVKHSSPVLNHGSAGSWDGSYILHPTVYFDGTTYHMWYTGTEDGVGKIGYATSPDSITWTKYSGNPVLTPGDPGSWDDRGINSPEVLFINGVFHMWFGGFDGSHEQIGHATSLNGIDWEKDTLNPVLKVGMAGSWDNASASQPSVLFDGKMFHMWYGGGPDFNWKIGYAYSIDGRIWQKDDTNNPLLGPGLSVQWAGYQTVCFNSDSTGFDMWYTAGARADYVGDIGYATASIASFDFENNPLIKYSGNPVFSRGLSGSWDDQLETSPTILYDGSVYRMWYDGYDGGTQKGSQTGYAYSIDGIIWERYPDPVVSRGPSGSWDDFSLFQPSVIFDSVSNQYKMWFCGHDGNFNHRKIGYATSPDTIQWTVYGSDPVLTTGPSGSWDDFWVESPNVLFIDGVYHMWYSGSDGTYVQIGHATSLNGIAWEKDTLNPVLRMGSAGSWDAGFVDNPWVIFDGNTYHMWYGGQKSYSWNWRIGYAYSYDGRNWIKSSVDNPVLDVGDQGSWDDKFVGVGGVATMFSLDAQGHRELKMWYGGGRAERFGDIGYASTDTLDFGVVDIESNLNVIPNDYALFQNYPNPFNPTTTIKYSIPKQSIVTLKIYDILGREITTLVNEEKTAGTYKIEFNASSLVSGVYFYKLQAGGFVETKKMILMK